MNKQLKKINKTITITSNSIHILNLYTISMTAAKPTNDTYVFCLWSNVWAVFFFNTVKTLHSYVKCLINFYFKAKIPCTITKYICPTKLSPKPIIFKDSITEQSVLLADWDPVYNKESAVPMDMIRIRTLLCPWQTSLWVRMPATRQGWG